MVKFVALAIAAVVMTVQSAVITTLTGKSDQCGGDFACPKDAELVCGKVGGTQNTYLNKCVMKCVDNAEFEFKGACLADLKEIEGKCTEHKDDRITCLKTTGCKFTGDEDGGINGDGMMVRHMNII